jgi:hypothetical protein
MKIAALAFATLFLAASLAAQTAAPPPPPPPMQHDHAMAGMGDQHMQQMKAQVEQMRATLNDMKANAAGIKDAAAKRQAQLDMQLWEKMVAHMEGMVNMMSSHAAGGHSMGCCGDMKDGKPGCCAGMKDDVKGGGMAAAGHDCCAGMQDGKAMSCCGEGGMSCGKPQKPAGDSLQEHKMEPPSR